ncbi:hypothetical protein MYP14_06135 [Rhodococcus pyridinivorans]|uniref:hypothetical protein n=1 Tax=Rhodococcus pyridinivorans TaxID=103816 RepID=UPI001FFE5BD7|nr:hypothetical protein [Rhodococcus pyridinivorans]UPK64928.1 hypothetical protein MYP14_06135 [Rhodococcus pyridinivorans]
MREYHCTTCDFHITGPADEVADEVADEIDAHEEQHHTDAAVVSGIEVDNVTALLIKEWAKHQSERPSDPADYLAHIDHLRQVMDRWTANDEALRLVIGTRLAQAALDQELSR